MTKARTKAKRRRGRPRKDGAPRDPSGRISRIKPERREAAQRTVALARCNLMGWPATAENMKTALEDHMGCTAGRAIHFEPQEERAALWAAIKRVRAVYVRYWSVIGAPPPYAKAAMLAYLPETFGSDGVEATAWDDRSDAERARSAGNAMMALEQALSMAGAGVANEVKGVVLFDRPVGDRERLLAGLRALA